MKQVEINSWQGIARLIVVFVLMLGFIPGAALSDNYPSIGTKIIIVSIAFNVVLWAFLIFGKKPEKPEGDETERLKQKLSGSREPTYEELKNEADAHQAANRFDNAASVWKRAVELHPDRVGGYNNLARNLFLGGGRDEALHWMEKAVELVPKDTEVQRNYGVLLLNFDRLDEAEACFIAAYNIAPNNWIAYLNMAEVNEKKGNRSGAVKWYKYVHDHAMGTVSWSVAFERLNKMGELA